MSFVDFSGCEARSMLHKRCSQKIWLDSKAKWAASKSHWLTVRFVSIGLGLTYWKGIIKPHWNSKKNLRWQLVGAVYWLGEAVNCATGGGPLEVFKCFGLLIIEQVPPLSFLTRRPGLHCIHVPTWIKQAEEIGRCGEPLLFGPWRFGFVSKKAMPLLSNALSPFSLLSLP